MQSNRLALYSLLVHAVLALAGAAIDIIVIAKYATISDDRKLVVTATSIAAVLFGAGCVLQAVLTHRHTRSWAAAARAFLYVELAYQAALRVWSSNQRPDSHLKTPARVLAVQQQQTLPAKGNPSATITEDKLRSLELAGQAQSVGHAENAAFELHGPAGKPAAKSQFVAAASLPASLTECPVEHHARQDHQPGQLLKAPFGSIFVQEQSERVPSAAVDGSKVIRMLKLVHFGLNLPQACLALIVYVQVWDAGTVPVNEVLIVNTVVGLAGCALIATEYFQYAEWSLWKKSSVSNLPSKSLGSKQLLTRARLIVVVKHMTMHMLFFVTSAVSIAARLLLFMFVSVVVKLITPQKYLNILMAGAAMLVWWFACSLMYYIISKQLMRSIKCGYLTMAMTVPFNPCAGKGSADPCMTISRCTQFKDWCLSICITLIASLVTTMLGILQSAACLLSRHDSIKYKEFGSCNYDEYQMGRALAILGAADGFLFCITCGLRACQKQ